MTMLLLSVLLACDLIEDLKSDDSGSFTEDTHEPLPEGATRNSQMPSASEESRKDWNCDFLTDMANTGLEEYGLVAIDIETTLYIYSEAEIPMWEKAASIWILNGINMVHGEVEYDGFFYQMTDTVVPNYLVASVTNGPVDFNLCRGYVWVEGL